MRPSVRFVKLESSGWTDRVGFAFGPLHWAIESIDFYAKSILIQTRSVDGRRPTMPGTWGVSRYGYGAAIACTKSPALLIAEAAELGRFVGVTISQDAHLAMWKAVPLIVSPRPNQNKWENPAVDLIGWQCWTVNDGPDNSGRIEFTRQAGIKKRIDYPVALSPGGYVMIPLRWVRDTIMADENLGRIADPLDGVRPSYDDRQLKLKGRW